MKRVLLTTCVVLALAGCDRNGPSQDAPSAPPATAPATGDTPVAASATETVQAVADKPAAPATAAAGAIHTPAAGSPERTALMDTLRAKVRGELGGDAVFVVKTLKSNGQWAFAELEPQWRDGRKIDPHSTPLYRQDPDWPFDGLHTEAIWRKVDGRWTVFAHSIGSTDVWWTEHCNTVPRGIMTGC